MNYKSIMEVPHIKKITINVGLGEAIKDKKIIEQAVSDIEKISGQKPIVTKAKKSIAAFSLLSSASLKRVALPVKVEHFCFCAEPSITTLGVAPAFQQSAITLFKRVSVNGRSVPSVAPALTCPASPVPEVVPLAPPDPLDTFEVR